MNKHRVKAFTIMEVTITMMVAAILIGITYTAYSIISKSYISFNTKNNDMGVLVQLDQLLKWDFGRAEIVVKDNDGVLFKNAGREVKYKFEPDFIIRTDVRVDTFKVKTDVANTFFKSQAIDETSSDEEQNRLDELEFNVLFQDEKIPYHYHKQYSSANLIQRNPDAVN